MKGDLNLLDMASTTPYFFASRMKFERIIAGGQLWTCLLLSDLKD